MAGNFRAAFRLLALAALLLGAGGQPAGEEYYFGIELNGVLCGYARIVVSPLAAGGRQLVRLEHEMVVRGTLLGAPVDNRMLFTYHLEPSTKRFVYHDSSITAGQTRLTSFIRIDGRTAYVSESPGGPEKAVDLPPDAVLDNTLFHQHLLADFGRGHAERKSYGVFDGREGALREVTYTRKGAERLELAGRVFDTVVLDVAERRTAVNVTAWLDTRTGIIVQIRQPGNIRSYLATSDVVQTVMQAGRRIDLDSTVLYKTNVAIQNVRAISFMKVSVAMRPFGLALTPEALTVNGQRFSGAVKDNLVEGVFEIEHPRYDGRRAPPFPPQFGADPALREYLAADGYIQSDDRVLREKAREITAGARDSWDAVRRLSRWVATEIKGALPGGITARGTYDQRAGECGGHSFLLAAFSRSVGIPARAVWGCLYVPQNGGAFGRHAWNEVYMGENGWIPLDTTAGEPDYVDSGHVRLGVVQSMSSGIDVRRIEVLEHRTSKPGGPKPGGRW